jgi:hypothetical protein
VASFFYMHPPATGWGDDLVEIHDRVPAAAGRGGRLVEGRTVAAQGALRDLVRLLAGVNYRQ